MHGSGYVFLECRVNSTLNTSIPHFWIVLLMAESLFFRSGGLGENIPAMSMPYRAFEVEQAEKRGSHKILLVLEQHLPNSNGFPRCCAMLDLLCNTNILIVEGSVGFRRRGDMMC